MPRPKVMMRLWAAIAQLGVRRVTLTIAARVEKQYLHSHAVQPFKYMPELLDGLEQAMCTRLPEVRIELRLKPFIEDVLDTLCPPDVLRLLCHPGDVDRRVAEAVASLSDGRRRPTPRGVLLAIGPEGGWLDFELDLLREHGFVEVSLGPRILTTEVAVVSLTTLAADALTAAAAAASGASTGSEVAEQDEVRADACSAGKAEEGICNRSLLEEDAVACPM